ncbi:MAG TPA: exosortase/archaeosortase family protein [Verrucomicrobiae bacterium]|jgi:exosortase C (VPDSG-CTERM-specific)|nr:exosortase/archaeosortase family protein [Verrucomicrobiae bacterium]
MIDSSERVLSGQLKRFAIFAVLLALCFAVPLWQLIRFSLHSAFFSYVPLVPFISGYLLRVNRSKIPAPASPNALGMALSAALGLGFLGWNLYLAHAGGLETTAHLALTTASFLFFLLASAFYFFGSNVLASMAFPIAFLIFFIPPPQFLLDPVVSFFQHTSAWAAVTMIGIFTPVISDGLEMRVPGITLMVAPECSGIHSTMVLLMTSLLAGYMFLRSGWRRAVLVLIVAPLAILRNGFRIFVIAELCVHIGPHMIDSPIHRHGGPIFFMLSLVPFFILLFWLCRQESPRKIPAATEPISTNL